MKMEYIFTVFSLVTTLACIILMIVSWWKIYDKMGEKGWKSLIPFYGRYVLFRDVWESKIYFISFIFSAISYVINGWMIFRFYQNLVIYGNLSFNSGDIGIIIFSLIFFFIAFAIQMILKWRLVKCFGKGIMFFFGLMLFPIVFIAILAFGNAYYDYY